LINLSSMEIILYSPNLYVHLSDAMIAVQFLIEGFAEIAGRFKI
jgi:hypothetical protein